MILEVVYAAVERKGLVPRGALALADSERSGPLANVRTIMLVGMAGRAGWDAFAASPEASDGADHPLDRFSRRVVQSLTSELGSVALYPFGGPPHWPFQQWAQRAASVFPSPIGLLITRSTVFGTVFAGRSGFALRSTFPYSTHVRTRAGLAKRVPASRLVQSARSRKAATTSRPAPAISRARPARPA